jgi:radical SAM-linked protein
MHRLRLRYTKEGRVRFVSARDLTAVWERAVRRAGLPIAYSEGFTPHAKVSFPDALPLGYASLGEYAEITFTVQIDPDRDLAILSDQLPEGMDILTFWEVPDGAPKLAKMLPGTLSEIVYADPAVTVEILQNMTDTLLTRERVEVTKYRPSGDKVVDIRPAIIDAGASLRTDHGVHGIDGPLPVLRVVFRNDGPSVRPTDLHAALAAASDSVLPDPRLYRRVAQGSPETGGLREALSQEFVELTPDRVAQTA